MHLHLRWPMGVGWGGGLYQEHPACTRGWWRWWCGVIRWRGACDGIETPTNGGQACLQITLWPPVPVQPDASNLLLLLLVGAPVPDAVRRRQDLPKPTQARRCAGSERTDTDQVRRTRDRDGMHCSGSNDTWIWAPPTCNCKRPVYS